jgi:nucleoside-diphosphate-sugar epimerase
MRVLVTGATGFIGKVVVQQLLDRGAAVCAFVRPESLRDVRKIRHLQHRPGVRIVSGRLDDARAVSVAVRGAEVVYHLAFLYREAWAPDQDFFNPNLRATTTVLRASVDAAVRRLVLSGSVSVYGWPHLPPEWPLTEENTALNGTGSYAETKIESERLVRAFTERYGIEHAVLRIPHVYGPGAATFEYFINRLLSPTARARNVRPVVDPTLFWGNIWQLVHVTDVAESLIRAGTRAGGRNGTFNIAGPSAITRTQLRRIVLERAQQDRPVAPWFRGARPGWPPFQIFDISKAERLLDFVPRVDVVDGLVDVVDRLLVSSDRSGG